LKWRFNISNHARTIQSAIDHDVTSHSLCNLLPISKTPFEKSPLENLIIKTQNKSHDFDAQNGPEKSSPTLLFRQRLDTFNSDNNHSGNFFDFDFTLLDAWVSDECKRHRNMGLRKCIGLRFGR